MSWVNPAKVAAGMALAASALALSASAQAGIVVAASGPSAAQFPAGKKVDDKGSITLKAGDSVTVLIAGKGTRVLRGPGTVSVGQGAGKSSTGVMAVFANDRPAPRVRGGFVRGGETGPVRSPNLWYVDLMKGGTTCVVNANAVRLWRADGAKAASYTLSGGGAKAGVSFAAGGIVAPWNASLPVKGGVPFTVSDSAGKAVSTVTFAVLAAKPANEEALAEALLANGCKAQLDLLAATLTPGS